MGKESKEGKMVRWIRRVRRGYGCKIKGHCIMHRDTEWFKQGVQTRGYPPNIRTLQFTHKSLLPGTQIKPCSLHTLLLV